ncbi:hypothetical protein BDV97DRAFT_362155 [Delphinella strobiligena]|nr:hypothetical protein BDV97DRAFT_362155 [Delphinella strobiligena]
MAASCANPQMIHNPIKSRTGVSVPKRQPRDEHLRIPHSSTLRLATPSKAPRRSTVALPRVPLPSRRGREQSSQCCSSPKLAENQSSAGAEDVNSKSCQGTRSGKASLETPRDQSRPGVPNVLEYYCREYSPQVATQTSDRHSESQAISTLDFGLTCSEPASQPSRPRTESSPAHLNGSRGVRAGAIDKALPSLPAPETPTYSLFPGSSKGSMDHSIRPFSLRTSSNASSSVVPLQSGMATDPIRPRKASLPSSVRSRADSCTSTRLLPSATIIPGNKSLPHAGKFPRIPLPIRVSSSIPTSPPSVQSAKSTSSRWSGDTMTHSHDSERPSLSSASSPPWPQMGSFFEDDDDEQVPLRKKVATRIRGARAWSASSAGSTMVGSSHEKREWYQRWMTCCAGNRRR